MNPASLAAFLWLFAQSPTPETPPSGGPAGTLASYVSNDDYPAAALQNREEGIVSFELIVGVDGLVRDCQIIASSGSASLDETTCRIMRERPRFRPARNSAGNPVEDRVRSRIRWTLAPEPAAPPAVRARAHANLASYIQDYPPEALGRNEQGVVHIALDVSPEGRVARCHVTISSGSAALDQETCRIMIQRARFTPARDAQGRPVADRIESQIGWAIGN